MEGLGVGNGLSDGMVENEVGIEMIEGSRVGTAWRLGMLGNVGTREAGGGVRSGGWTARRTVGELNNE